MGHFGRQGNKFIEISLKFQHENIAPLFKYLLDVGFKKVGGFSHLFLTIKLAKPQFCTISKKDKYLCGKSQFPSYSGCTSYRALFTYYRESE